MKILYEHKIINKHLMLTRNKNEGGEYSSWRVESNIFELIKAYLLWNYPKDLLPHIVPWINEDAFPTLRDWYDVLSKPNSPYKRVYKVPEADYKAWLIALDLSKPYDSNACASMFEDVASATKRNVDAVEISENENRADI